VTRFSPVNPPKRAMVSSISGESSGPEGAPGSACAALSATSPEAPVESRVDSPYEQVPPPDGRATVNVGKVGAAAWAPFFLERERVALETERRLHPHLGDGGRA